MPWLQHTLCIFRDWHTSCDVYDRVVPSSSRVLNTNRDNKYLTNTKPLMRIYPHIKCIHSHMKTNTYNNPVLYNKLILVIYVCVPTLLEEKSSEYS